MPEKIDRAEHLAGSMDQARGKGGVELRSNANNVFSAASYAGMGRCSGISGTSIQGNRRPDLWERIHCARAQSLPGPGSG